MATVNEKMTAIADSIRAKTGGTELLNLDQMASAVDDVYEAGKKAEYDAFWDSVQKNGTEPMRYFYAFANSEIWTQERIEQIKYKHLIANYFAVAFNSNTAITDLSMLSMETNITSTGNHATVTISSCFTGCSNLVKCMPLNFNYINAAPNAFNGCAALEEFYALGTIKFDGLSFKDSHKLNKASFESIVRAYSATIEGLSCTFSEQARAAAFTDEEWEALRAERPKVTFYFV